MFLIVSYHTNMSLASLVAGELYYRPLQLFGRLTFEML